MVQDQLAKLMSPTSHHLAGRPRCKRPKGHGASMSGRVTIPTIEYQGLSVFQLNVEGLTTAKMEVIYHLADSHKVAAVLLQETHRDSDNILKLPGFQLAGSTHSKQHGLATFVRNNLSWTATGQSPPGSSIEWLSTKVQTTTVVNVYKPPPSMLTMASLPPAPAPAIYAGDFNCQHIDWGYSHTTPNGEILSQWASSANALLLFDPVMAIFRSYYQTASEVVSSVPQRCTQTPVIVHETALLVCVPLALRPLPPLALLLHLPLPVQFVVVLLQVVLLGLFSGLVESGPDRDPKEPPSFFSARWNTHTNPDLAFAVWHTAQKPERRVLDRFPRSHHRPSIIKIQTTPMWTLGMQLTAEYSLGQQGKPSPVALTQITSRAGMENAATSCMSTSRQAPGRKLEESATVLLQKLDATRRSRWIEVIQSIDFTHSSRKAWRTINQLTGRTPSTSRCPITANAIASQLLKNSCFPDADKNFARTTSHQSVRTSVWLCSFYSTCLLEKQKAGVVLLDLTAAYDTVWHRGLNLKLLKIIPDRHIVKFIIEMVTNRSFTLKTSDGQCSRLRRLRNGVPQGSVLAPMLFNIYIHDLPETTSRKYGYADDLAIMMRRKTWEQIQASLNQDMDTLAAYLREWRLQLSIDKTVVAAYHLNNSEARRELDIFVNNKRLEFQQAPRWGATAKVLRISTVALVFSTAEYCAPAWCRSPHARQVDTAINTALRTITGCLNSTPVYHLPTLAGIAPAGLRREAATLALARKAQRYNWHILHNTTTTALPPHRLKSRHPYNKAAQDLLRSIPEDLSTEAWLAAAWKQEWESAGPSRIHRYIYDPGGGLEGEDLPRRQWTLLNRLRTGVGRYKASMRKWGLEDRAVCECGEPEQTAEHIITTCPLYKPPSEAGLFDVGPEMRTWLSSTELDI
ncbi:unnamed protein product [Leuciscus chuanchicus]